MTHTQKKGKRSRIHKSAGSWAFDLFNYLFLTLFCLTILLPFWYLLVLSFDEFGNVTAQDFFLWPRAFTLENYKTVAENPAIWRGYANTIFRTVCGTFLSLLCTSMAAFALSKNSFPNRKFWSFYVVFTMFFSGGMIPTYLWIKDLHLLDNRLVLILPGLVGAYNLVLIRNFFKQIPPELEESARIDGASDFRVFWNIILPVSKPILATIALWLAVGHWNAWFDCLIYIRDTRKYVLQIILQRIVIEGTIENLSNTEQMTEDFNARPEMVKAACIYFTTLPILCVYPFLQKYFVKGIYVGSLKG